MLLAAIKYNAIQQKEEDPFPSLKFIVEVAGFIPRAENLKKYFQNVIDIPSLHVIGELDNVSIELPMKAFKHSQKVIHPGGHVIPKTEHAIQEVVEYIKFHI